MDHSRVFRVAARLLAGECCSHTSVTVVLAFQALDLHSGCLTARNVVEVRSEHADAGLVVTLNSGTLAGVHVQNASVTELLVNLLTIAVDVAQLAQIVLGIVHAERAISGYDGHTHGNNSNKYCSLHDIKSRQ